MVSLHGSRTLTKTASLGLLPFTCSHHLSLLAHSVLLVSLAPGACYALLGAHHAGISPLRHLPLLLLEHSLWWKPCLRPFSQKPYSVHLLSCFHLCLLLSLQSFLLCLCRTTKKSHLCARMFSCPMWPPPGGKGYLSSVVWDISL